MANDNSDTLDRPDTPDRRRGICPELAVIALYTSGFALAHALMHLAPLLFTQAGR